MTSSNSAHNFLFKSDAFNAETAYAYRNETNVKRKKAVSITTSVLERNAPHRGEVEEFIAQVFADAYGAEIKYFIYVN